MTEAKLPGIRLRQAAASDAQAIGAVFDAAVRVGWTYLGDLATEPMFSAADWDKDVADHAPPNVLLVATDEGDRVVGFTAAHPQDCEMFLLFVDPTAAGRGVGRMLLAAADDALRAANRSRIILPLRHRQKPDCGISDPWTGLIRRRSGNEHGRRADCRSGALLQ